MNYICRTATYLLESMDRQKSDYDIKLYSPITKNQRTMKIHQKMKLFFLKLVLEDEVFIFFLPNCTAHRENNSNDKVKGFSEIVSSIR